MHKLFGCMSSKEGEGKLHESFLHTVRERRGQRRIHRRCSCVLLTSVPAAVTKCKVIGVRALYNALYKALDTAAPFCASSSASHSPSCRGPPCHPQVGEGAGHWTASHSQGTTGREKPAGIIQEFNLSGHNRQRWSPISGCPAVVAHQW